MKKSFLLISLFASISAYANIQDNMNWEFTYTPSCSSNVLCENSNNNLWQKYTGNWGTTKMDSNLATINNGILSLRVPGTLQSRGGQVQSIQQNYGLGKYTSSIKAGTHGGLIQGTSNGFFVYNSSSQKAIGVRILSSEHAQRIARFFISPNNIEVTCSLPDEPQNTFIDYGFEILSDKVNFFINNQQCASRNSSNVDFTGKIVLNHSTGYSLLGGLTPLFDSVMQVDKVEYLSSTYNQPLNLYLDELFVVYKGGNANITWVKKEEFANSPVSLELWKNGQFNRIIATNISANNYLWNVPNDLGNGSDYQIKLKSNLGEQYFDFSEPFSIAENI